MEPRHPVVYTTALDYPEAIVPLFLERAAAEAYFSGLEVSLETFIDDVGVAFPSHWRRRDWDGDAQVQRFLLERLFRLSDPRFLRGVECAFSHPDLYLYAEAEKLDQLSLAHCIGFELPVHQVPLRPESLAAPAVGAELILLATAESIARREICEPVRVDSDRSDLALVTAGMQSGLGISVENFKRYWLRFLRWYRSEFGSDGRRCAVSLSYVDSLSRYSSLYGFFLAVNENMPELP